ncbi:MAG: hypothetical protein WBP41_07105 [Saprospiraceae bacterium]
MTPQPDKLFREALEDFNRPAPASAWNRIETGLDRKKSNGLWWKIAAGILLLIAASFIFWPHDTILPAVALNHQDENKSTENTKLPITSSAEVPVVSAVPAKHVEFIPNKKIKRNSPVTITGIEVEENNHQVVSNEKENEVSVPTSVEPVENIVEPDEIVADASVSVLADDDETDVTQGRNMKYTSQEVNTRFMKKVIPAEATHEKKSASGVKKVIDVAFGFKNNDSLLGDLRQLKNEYLTINFPDKKRDPTK